MGHICLSSKVLIFSYQIAGALAEEGKSLEEVTKWAKLATESMGKQLKMLVHLSIGNRSLYKPI